MRGKQLIISLNQFQLPCKTHQLYQWVQYESAKPWAHRKLGLFLGEPETTKSCDTSSTQVRAGQA